MKFIREVVTIIFLLIGSFSLVGCGDGETSYSLDDLQTVLDTNSTSAVEKQKLINSAILTVQDRYGFDKNKLSIVIDIDLTDDIDYTLLDDTGIFEIIDGTLQIKDTTSLTLGKTTIIIVVEDSEGNRAQKVVVIVVVEDLDTVEPVILTSSFSIEENSRDTLLLQSSLIGNGKLQSYAFSGGLDDALFTLSNDGKLELIAAIDYEDSSISHSLEVKVVAEDDLANVSDVQTITINIIDVDEAYTFTSAKSFDVLNSATTVATVVAVANNAIMSDATYSFEATSNELSIDSATGIITFTVSTPTLQEHTINVIAQNNFNGSYTVQPITINIVEDFSKIRPVITTTSFNTDENKIEDMLVNIATLGTGVVTSYYISGTDSSYFTFYDGNVRFIDTPDFEAKNSYSINLQVEDSFGNVSDDVTVIISINNLGPTSLKILTVSNSIESPIWEQGSKVTETKLKAEEYWNCNRTYNVEFGANGLSGLKYTIIANTSNNMFDVVGESDIKVLNVWEDTNKKDYAFTIKVCDTNNECMSQPMIVNIY